METTATENKVRFNLKNVHWALLKSATDGTLTYDAPHEWPGAVSMKCDPQGDATPFYADGMIYYQTLSNTGYSIDLESALVPEDFLHDVLKQTQDAKKVDIENSDDQPAHFCLMFECEGDQKAIRHIFYDCVPGGRPKLEYKTKEDKTEVQTETLSVTSEPIYCKALDKNIVKGKTSAETDATAYSGWYTTPYVPTATAGA